MTKFRHNKKRNSAFLYEALIQELAKSIFSKDEGKKNKIVTIIKESFNQNSFLYKEMKLYRSISDTNGVDTSTAEKIINEAKRQHSEMNQKKLLSEQNVLVRKIRKSISSDVFSNFIPNYKSLASIYQIFNSQNSIKSKVLLENEIVTKMSSENLEEKMKPIDNLVFKSFTKRFNEKYKKELFEEQKELFSKFILSFANNGIELNSYLNEEIGRLKKSLQGSLELDEIKEDQKMIKKTKEVFDLLESYKVQKPDEKMILEIAKIQNLIRELSSDVS
tara:strand:+ start:843 stop:1670 length:828 start_codon:yes stop_codon:yes gene_type:complete